MTPNTLKALMEYSALPVLDDSGDEVDGLSQGQGN